MRRIAAVVFAVLLALPAMAQEVWPSRPITLISPYAPGGASDFLARTLAEAGFAVEVESLHSRSVV